MSGGPTRLGSGALRHGHVIPAVAYLPGGRALATGSYDGLVKLWDPATGAETRRFPAHDGGVTCLATSPDGTALASGGLDGYLRVWDLDTGLEVLAVRADPAAVTAAVYTPDAAEIITAGSEGVLRRWRGATEIGSLKGHTHAVNALRVSADGSRLASGGWDRTARVWDLRRGAETRRLDGHGGWLQSLDFSPDAGTLAWGRDRDVVLTPLTGGGPRVLSGHAGEVCAVRYTPGGARLVSVAFDREVRRWDLETGTSEVVVDCPPGIVYQLDFSPDGRELALAGGSALARHRLPTMDPVDLVEGHRGAVQALAWDGDRPVSGSVDGTVRVWEAGRAARVLAAEPHPGAVAALAVEPATRRVLVGTWDGRARVWSLADGALAGTYPAHVGGVVAAAWGPAGADFLTAGRDGVLCRFRPGTPTPVGRWAAHPGGVLGLGYSPNGRVAVSAGRDGKWRVWDAQRGAEMAAHPLAAPAACLALSPDGARVAIGGAGGTLRVYRLADGAATGELALFEGWVFAAAFSPDGGRLVAGGEGGQAALVDLATGAVTAPLPGHEGWVCAAAFAPDGARVATGGGDTGVLVTAV